MACVNNGQKTCEEILQEYAGLQAARYTSAAATAIYLYNIPLTLDIEVEHIWSRLSFDLPTVLYMVNRYICLGFFLVAIYALSGFHADFSDAYCRIPLDLIGIGLAHTGWTGIISLRVCAIWRQRRKLVWIILILWIAVIGIMTVIMYLAYQEAGATLVYNAQTRICVPTTNPHIFKAVSVPPVIYEFFLTVLTVIKVFDFGVHPSSATIPMLYRVIVRDGLVYFAIGATISIINTASLYILSNNNFLLLFSLYLAIMSTVMARLVLNLRIAHQESVLEQLGSQGVTGNTWSPSYHSEFRGMPARIILGERDVRVDTRHPTSKSSEGGEYEESWNVANAHIAPPIPLKSMDTFRRNSNSYAATLPDDAGQTRRRGLIS